MFNTILHEKYAKALRNDNVEQAEIASLTQLCSIQAVG